MINLAERGFDPRTSGLWAQHASTAPLCYRTINWKIWNMVNVTNQSMILGANNKIGKFDFLEQFHVSVEYITVMWPNG
jgi:hypothetical protein